MTGKPMSRRAGLLAATLSLWLAPAQAGWQDMLRDMLDGGGQEAEPGTTVDSATGAPDAGTMNRAVLDALQVGVRRAVDTLGRPGGFLQDQAVRIPLPQELQSAESLLRRLGQDRYADAFIESMNRAAEQAVPQTTDILLDTIRGMSVSDARGIIQGGDDAATRYFREHSSAQLAEVIRPIVSENMDRVGVTARYKQFVSSAGFLESFVAEDTLDLDAYVTNRTLDGLFLKLAAEEKRIREQPVARSTEILKDVFGYFDR